MDQKADMLESRILKKEREIQGFYQKLLSETDEVEKQTIIRDILLQKEMNELIMRSISS